MTIVPVTVSVKIAMIIRLLQERAGSTSLVGAIAGWMSFIEVSHAREWVQLFAASAALLVSICALIITGPVAVKKFIGWFKSPEEDES